MIRMTLALCALILTSCAQQFKFEPKFATQLDRAIDGDEVAKEEIIENLDPVQDPLPELVSNPPALSVVILPPPAYPDKTEIPQPPAELPEPPMDLPPAPVAVVPAPPALIEAPTPNIDAPTIDVPPMIVEAPPVIVEIPAPADPIPEVTRPVVVIAPPVETMPEMETEPEVEIVTPPQEVAVVDDDNTDDEGDEDTGDDEEEGELCLGSKNKKCVVLCHVPPGNSTAAHTIVISETAFDAHLNRHHHGDSQDYLGECQNSGSQFVASEESGSTVAEQPAHGHKGKNKL
jgi:hypothetical protein